MFARAIAILVTVAACSSGAVDSVSELEDPSTCLSCHPTHYTQWAGSMHAYASVDPVFVAMNARGQRDTNNALGTFCVKCHAPMAVQLGLTDGITFDPAKLPPAANGVTCYFCHDVASVTADHNNGLQLAMDQTMRGGLQDPTDSPAHDSEYDATLMDMQLGTSNSSLCGSCHDVVTPGGVAVERTFKEWKQTFFATLTDQEHHLSCGACHMRAITGEVATGGPTRDFGVHEHVWPGIDTALGTFPDQAEQVTDIHRDLDPAIGIVGATPLTGPPAPGGICLIPFATSGTAITVRMDSLGTGHDWPSGAGQDRRAWLELIAYDANNNVLYQSGVVPPTADPEAQAGSDTALLALYDRMAGSDGTTPVHFMWQVTTEPCPSPNASVTDNCLLKKPITNDPTSPLFDHSTTWTFPVTADVYNTVDHIAAQIHIRPYSYAMLQDLVSSGDLDASLATSITTFDILGSMATWSRATAGTGPAINTLCSPQ